MFKQKETLIILWLTFLTVVVWIGLSIYHIWATSTISDIDAASIVPINPEFDINTINKLKNREDIEPLYQINASTPTPVSSPIPVATEQPAVSAPVPTTEPTIFIPAPEVSELPVPDENSFPEIPGEL